MNINLKDGTWEHRKSTVYYRNKPRNWYCKECNYLTPSARKIGEHTVNEHGFHLPRSRNVEPEQPEVILQKVDEPQLTKNIPKIFSSTRINYTPPLFPADWDPVKEAKKKKELENKQKIEQIKIWRREGCLSREEAQIECLKIIWPEYLSTFLKNLREEKEREGKIRALILETFVRNQSDKIRSQI